MNIKGTPDLPEALFLVLKYVLKLIIPGEHWIPKNLRDAIYKIIFVAVFIVGIILAYAKLTAGL